MRPRCGRSARRCPAAGIEVLVPDFRGAPGALGARPFGAARRAGAQPRDRPPPVRPGAARSRLRSLARAAGRGRAAQGVGRRRPDARQDRPHARARGDRRRGRRASLPTAPRPASTWSPWVSTCGLTTAACRWCAMCPPTSSPPSRRAVSALACGSWPARSCAPRIMPPRRSPPVADRAPRAATTVATWPGTGVALRAVLFDVDFTVLRPSALFSAAGYAATGARFGLSLDPGPLGGGPAAGVRGRQSPSRGPWQRSRRRRLRSHRGGHRGGHGRTASRAGRALRGRHRRPVGSLPRTSRSTAT